MDAREKRQHLKQEMVGRVKRRRGLQESAERAARVGAAAREGAACAFCLRELGSRVEWHHRVPKSKGGVETVPLHPICHRAIHAHITNRELAGEYADLDELREHEDMRRFLRWVANKPADFHAPTRPKRM